MTVNHWLGSVPLHKLQQMLLLWLLLWIPFSAMGTTSTGWQALAQKVQQSPHDPRHYQAIQLDNGMKVLLVSDAKAPFSMTAMALPVGSLHDPAQHAGLAHYLEHMLFLGSEHYPEGIDVGHNASTSSNCTIYMASVYHPWLALTLDKLADALAAPDLDPQLADKERQAVHQEALGHRTDNNQRIWQINRETLNPKHPFARFAAGNLETLSDKPGSTLQQALQTFHQRFYSANIMVAVIYGNQPLSALAHLASESYGRIPNRQATVQPITIPLATAKQQGVMIHYVPAQPYNALQFDFVISPSSGELHSTSYFYLQKLLTSKSPGTLSDWLQQQGLATQVSAWYQDKLAGNAGLFSLYIAPTEQGMAQRDVIIAAVWRYLKLLQQQGIQPAHFEQMARQLEMHFHYSPGQANLSYVHELANNLLYYPVENVVNAGYLATHYDPQAIKKQLAQMTAHKARIWMTSPNEPHNKEAYFLKAPYQIKPVTSQQIKHWENSAKTIALKQPMLNPYLPTDFSLIPLSTRAEKPTLVFQSAGVRAWLKPSRYFPTLPKVDITLALRNPPTMRSLRQGVLMSLLFELTVLETGTFLNMAHEAGVTLSVDTRGGLILRAQGFSQKLPLLLTQLLQKMQNVTFNEEQLRETKYRMRQSLESHYKQDPYQQATHAIKEVSFLFCKCKELKQQIALLHELNSTDILTYRDQLFKPDRLDLLAIGNLSQQQLTELAKKLQQQLGIKNIKNVKNNKDIEKIKKVKNKRIVIDKPIKALLNQSVSVDGAALSALYIPTGYDETSGQANARLLSSLLHTWFFDQLRTQEQLAYHLEVTPECIGEHWGLLFSLQSADKNPAQIYQRYQAFYQQAWQQLQKLKEKREFAAYQRNLLKQLRQEPTQLGDEVSPLYQDFLDEVFSFDQQEKMIARVKALTAEEVLQFYQQAILKPTGLALLSQVQGIQQHTKENSTSSTFAIPQGWTRYSSPSALQQQLLSKK